jgi:hypothetical protein
MQAAGTGQERVPARIRSVELRCSNMLPCFLQGVLLTSACYADGLAFSGSNNLMFVAQKENKNKISPALGGLQIP